MEDKCGTIESEIVAANMTEPVKYSISHYANDGTGPVDTLFQEYSRPVYSHVSGLPDVKEGDINWLVYTGRRCIILRLFMTYFLMIGLFYLNSSTAMQLLQWYLSGGLDCILIWLNIIWHLRSWYLTQRTFMVSLRIDFFFELVCWCGHAKSGTYFGQTETAFWSNAYSGATSFVSDPTTGGELSMFWCRHYYQHLIKLRNFWHLPDNPVGVDFYWKGEVNTEENNQWAQ